MHSVINDPDKDPLGKMFLDYYNGNHDVEVIVRSSMFDIDIITGAYLFRSLQDMPMLEQRALEYCHGKILDVGAGSGCHSLALKRMGFDVYPIDLSPLAVQVMKERGLNAQHTNFLDYEEKEFDTLLMMMNGIGICGTLDKLPEYLTKCRKLLNSGGKVILESTDLRYLYTNDDGSISIDLNAPYYGEVDFQFEYEGFLGDKFDWLYVDFDTLHYYANHAGFKAELVFNSDYDSYLAVLRVK